MTVLLGGLAALAVLLWPARTARRPGAGPGGGEGMDALSTASRAAHRLAARWPGRTRPAAGEVADALVLVALGLRSGLPLAAVLHHVQDGARGTVRDELAAVEAALRWGRPTGEAWRYAGPSWRAAALATHLSEETGAAAAELLEAAAARMREQDEQDRERAAARAGVLLVLPLGLGFLPAFACTAVVPVVVNLAAGVFGNSP